MSPTPCFWVEDTGQVELSLRRYVSGDHGCPGAGGYHNAHVDIGRADAERAADSSIGMVPVTRYADDPRWPVRCDGCDYLFVNDDQWQVNQERVYRRAGTSEEHSERRLPPGAMLDATWYHDTNWVGADGISLIVVLPGSDTPDDTRGRWWLVDGPPSNDRTKVPGWQRTGDPRDPPTLSVTPSIDAGGSYHGFLTAGALSASI